MEYVKLHLGIIWVVKIDNGWFQALKSFPQAQKPDDPAVQKYLKERGLL